MRKNRINKIGISLLWLFLIYIPPLAGGADDKDRLYRQFQLLCGIIDAEYATFNKTNKTLSDRMQLIERIDQKRHKQITDPVVNESYSQLLTIGADDPYAMLQYDVKSRTGKAYTCDAFKSMVRDFAKAAE